MLTNYQAEYGRTGGAQINVISKSGTRDFHGGAYWFKRHENLNANDFINNKFGLPKPIYRFSNFGFTFGGPFISLTSSMPTRKRSSFSIRKSTGRSSSPVPCFAPRYLRSSSARGIFRRR